MIRSMTGYSSGRMEAAGFSLSMQVKTFNHRFLDLQFRLPFGLESLEPWLRQTVKSHVARGHVELNVVLDRTGNCPARVDRALLREYVEACRQVRQELNYTSEVNVETVLRIPGVVVSSSSELQPQELHEVRMAVEALAGATLGRLNEMRAREGQALEDDVRGRLNRLTDLAAAVQGLAGRMLPAYQRRLDRRLRDMVGNAAVDPSRLAQEVIFLSSRSDIAEELTRLESHIRQVRQLLEEASDVGKKLDFLLQEMNREANTVLSKTTDVPEVGSEIARHAIEMKTEIEKLREQAQNIE